MRSSLFETQEIDRYLLKKMSEEESAIFQSRMIISDELKEKVLFQKKAHQFVRWFARDRKRQLLQRIYDRLLEDKKFKTEMETIFKY